MRAEFQPAAAAGPEVELVFETPHPFAETFEEEEVIADRYAAGAAPAAASSPAAKPAPSVAAVAVAEAAEEVKSVSITEDREKPQPMTVPMPHDRKLLWTDRPETEVAAATAAAVAVAEEPSPRPSRSVVPPPRQEFGRLFAKLRRGL